MIFICHSEWGYWVVKTFLAVSLNDIKITRTSVIRALLSFMCRSLAFSFCHRKVKKTQDLMNCVSLILELWCANFFLLFYYFFCRAPNLEHIIASDVCAFVLIFMSRSLAFSFCHCKVNTAPDFMNYTIVQKLEGCFLMFLKFLLCSPKLNFQHLLFFLSVKQTGTC